MHHSASEASAFLEEARELAKAYLCWFKEDALPFWMTRGIDEKTGASWEKLDANGAPLTQSPRRARVQSRQIFVYSLAAMRGWIDQSTAESIVDKLQSVVDTYARHATKPGYVHLLNSDLSQQDTKQDLYDHAFHILANVWRASAFDDAHAQTKAKQLLAHLDENFCAESGGFSEGDYPVDARRQNPHMHLFETFIAGAELSSDLVYSARAGEMYQLFAAYFYDGKFGVLREFFNENWEVLDSDKGDIIEPGHMLEWAWLLLCYQNLADRDLYKDSLALFESAVSLGQTEGDLFFDEVSPSGEPIKRSKRSWAMTEYIKSASRLYVQSPDTKKAYFAEHLARAIRSTMQYYIEPANLSPAGRGAYIDQIGDNQQAVSSEAQASTLYHYAVAAAELEGFLEACA